MSNSFVTRDPATGNLMLDGRRYRCSGANTPYVGLCENSSKYGAPVDSQGLHLASHAEIDATLDGVVRMGGNLIRCYSSVFSVGKIDAVQPILGQFNEAALEPTDYLLKRCNELGLRAVFPFVDNYPETSTGYKMGGKFTYCNWLKLSTTGDAAAFYTAASAREAFKAHIAFVLNHTNSYTGVRYGDDPAVLAWETGNEMSVYPDPWIHTDWTDDISHHIKANAQQLVMDGHYDVDPNIAQLSAVDICSTHAYIKYRNPAFCEAQGQQAHAAGKALIIGEYRSNDGDATWWSKITGQYKGWTLSQGLTAWETSTVIDGDAYWELLAPLTTWGGGYMLHYPGDNSTMKANVAKIAAHHRVMIG